MLTKIQFPTPFLNRCHRALCVPEQKVSPPENPNYKRNLKLEQIAIALGTVESLVDQLDQLDIVSPKFVTEALEYLVNELRAKEGE